MESCPPWWSAGCVWEKSPGLRGATERNIDHEAVRAPTVAEDTKGSTLHFSPSSFSALSLSLSLSSTFNFCSSSFWVLWDDHLHSATWLCETPHIVVNNIQWDSSPKYKEREFTPWRGIMSEKSQLRATMLRINGAMHYSAWGGRKGKRKDRMR